MQSENFQEGVIAGIVASFVISLIVIWVTSPAFGSVIFILSLALLPGFFITSALYVYKMGREKISRSHGEKKFDWDVEINLKKLEILYRKHSSMIRSALIVASASFLSMVLIAIDFPRWGTGHFIFFPMATVMFVGSVHFAFRWWLAIRSNAHYLLFVKRRER
jgi:hypothetical protein